MKKYSPLLMLCAILVFASCSKPATNNDPVIGIWVNTISNNSIDQKNVQTEYEWIFNDAYLGRFHQYENNVITAQTDFSWKKENGIYTISYPGLEKSDDVVTLVSNTFLQNSNGEIVAKRE
tara:strand:+ start:1241 stop:1603 length:363 start_codon:yes stop_codon:yes gene_type:complete